MSERLNSDILEMIQNDESAKNRFWDSVDKSGLCWVWTKLVSSRGYGKFTYKNIMLGAHRVSYLLSTGINPYKLHVLHKCDNTVCVNPDHLFLGTQADNMRDKIEKGRGIKSKLSVADVEKIKSSNLEWREKLKEAARLGISITYYNEILNNKRPNLKPLPNPSPEPLNKE